MVSFIESLEFGQLETATSLYICRLCVILIIGYASLYIESFAHKYTSIHVHAAFFYASENTDLLLFFLKMSASLNN